MLSGAAPTLAEEGPCNVEIKVERLGVGGVRRERNEK